MSDITNFTEITDGLDPDDIIYAGRPSDTGNADKNTKKKNMLLKGIHLNPNRIALQELVSGALGTPGLYTIAETEDSTAIRTVGDILLANAATGSGMLGFKYAVSDGSSDRTFLNTTLEITHRGGFGSFNNAINSVRLAKSSVSGAGFKLQIRVDATVNTLSIQLRNLDQGTSKGFQLVTPYLDNAPKLPDGVTNGTFLEAGAELVVSNVSGVRANGKISAIASGNDQLRVTAIWDEIPMQATNVSITGFTSFRFFDLDRNGSVTLGSFTTAAIVIKGKVITFNINQTGIATGLATFEPLAGVFDGADGKLILS